jgi:hypothetical protein
MLKKLVLLSAVVAAISVPAASASPAYTITGLRVHPEVGAFGSAEVGSCTGATYSACVVRTFTLENVGSEPIFVVGWGISDPAEFPSFGLGNTTFPFGCDALPRVDGIGVLAPGSSCQIAAVFVPQEKGPVWGELHVWGVPFDLSAPIAVIPLFGVGV